MTTTRRLGQGYAPHVDAVDGRLVYSLPVDAGFNSLSFAFEIAACDLAVLQADRYRRAVLECLTHAGLQRAMIPGRPAVTQADFAALLATVLHATPEALQDFIATQDRDHAMATEAALRQILARPDTG